MQIAGIEVHQPTGQALAASITLGVEARGEGRMEASNESKPRRRSGRSIKPASEKLHQFSIRMKTAGVEKLESLSVLFGLSLSEVCAHAVDALYSGLTTEQIGLVDALKAARRELIGNETAGVTHGNQ